MMSEDHAMLHQFCFEPLEVMKGDIVRVGEAFAACEARQLLLAVLRSEIGWDVSEAILQSSAGRVLTHKAEAALAVMGLASREGPESPSALMVPWEHFELARGEGMVRRQVEAAMVPLEQLVLASDALACCGGPARTVQHMKALSRRMPDNGVWAWSHLRQSLDDLAVCSWPCSLAQLVWLPASLCQRERLCVLGSIFWSMTYLGIDASTRRPMYGERLSPACRPSHDACPSQALLMDDAPHAHDGHGAWAVPGADTSSFFCIDQEMEAALRGQDPAEAQDGLAQRTANIVRLLNYNSWIDLLEAAVRLSDVACAA